MTNSAANTMERLFRLDGRIALVTGASSGLGRHFANVLADSGASVALAARRLDRLRELASGDSITVTREDGSVTVFVATDIRQYPKAEFPTQTVYGDIDHAGLRLITCGGAFDSSASSYDDNIIAYAALSETIIP